MSQRIELPDGYLVELERREWGGLEYHSATVYAPGFGWVFRSFVWVQDGTAADVVRQCYSWIRHSRRELSHEHSRCSARCECKGY